MGYAFSGGMNGGELKCPACGETMRRVKVLPKIMARLNRYRCQCGYCEDVERESDTSREQTPVRFEMRTLTQPA
jgi:transposase-like protein